MILTIHDSSIIGIDSNHTLQKWIDVLGVLRYYNSIFNILLTLSFGCLFKLKIEILLESYVIYKFKFYLLFGGWYINKKVGLAVFDMED